ncbi:ubiquitin-protein ligase [Lithospermum erythrorhizon]|uniref:RBR-type E3 ubiquitin transferase n=1 Tax=Lithospermum erythrorhizon TaxID=34254 RepID=A0AAV3PGB4_LITER
MHYCDLKTKLKNNSSSSTHIKSNQTINKFKLYFKSIMHNKQAQVMELQRSLFGIGIVILDQNGTLVFEKSKGVVENDAQMSNEVAEVMAFIEGLNASSLLGFKNIDVFSDVDTVFRLITGKLGCRGQKLAVLIEEATLLVLKFSYCHAYVQNRDHSLVAVKLARDGIVAKRKELIETCGICYTDTYIDQMLSADGCVHRYCFACIKKHVEAKLLQGMGLPKCPHEGCDLEVKLDKCRKFLTVELFDLMSERFKEATIPAAQKVYCPYPRCSVLMSRSDLQGWTCSDQGATRCRKCDGLFCISCLAAWHSGMTCSSFKQSNPPLFVEEATVKAIAAKHFWRQCSVCNHIVSLVQGCYHITCRCGHEFCYLCGAEWKNKRATCTCPYWDERNIIYS